MNGNKVRKYYNIQLPFSSIIHKCVFCGTGLLGEHICPKCMEKMKLVKKGG